jgi:hypothetical protein
MNIWTSIHPPAIKKEFESRFNRLRTTPYKHLKELPEYSSDTIKIDNRDITFTTYRNITEEDGLEIVLKISMPAGKLLFTKVGYVTADGFSVTANGKTESLPKEVLYDYA